MTDPNPTRRFRPTPAWLIFGLPGSFTSDFLGLVDFPLFRKPDRLMPHYVAQRPWQV